MFCFAIGFHNKPAYKIGHKLIESLNQCCIDLGYQSCLISNLNYIPLETKYLIFIPESFAMRDIQSARQKHPNIIFIHLCYNPLPYLDINAQEQGIKRDWTFYNDTIKPYLEYVNYIFHASKAATRFLNSRGHRCFHLPMGYHQNYEYINPQKTIGISHLGNPTRYRKSFIDYLFYRGFPSILYNIDWTDYNSYLKNMASSIITLNIGMHENERFFPSCRVVLFAFCNKTLVLSERCIDPDGCQDGVHFVTFDGRRDLLRKVKFYYKNIEARQKIVDNAYNYAKWNSLQNSFQKCINDIEFIKLYENKDK